MIQYVKLKGFAAAVLRPKQPRHKAKLKLIAYSERALFKLTYAYGDSYANVFYVCA